MGHTCTIVLLVLVLYPMESGINSSLACSAPAYLPKVLPRFTLGSEIILLEVHVGCLLDDHLFFIRH